MTKRKTGKGVRPYRSVVNVFGCDSPHENLRFPSGNLTAAELVAYAPHWLKSIDVVDRFITHGSKAKTLAIMINKFRDQPGNIPINANSVMSIMQVSMRYAGFTKWTKTNHAEMRHFMARDEKSEDDLDVSTLRVPGLTHPKTTRVNYNKVAAPQEFRDLAIHVKKHPEGNDALDLTRCVKYAVEHPDESWLFPDDFERLLQVKLGGPAQVTSSHFDREIFARYYSYYGGTAPDSLLIQEYSPLPKNQIRTSRAKGTPHIVQEDSPPHKVQTSTPRAKATPHKKSPSTMTSRKSLSTPGPQGGNRRSGRLAKKPAVNLRDDSDFGSPLNPSKKTTPGVTPTPTRKRKAAVHDDDDSEFDQNDAEVSSPESLIDDKVFTPAPTRRRAAKKARQTIQTIALEQQPKPRSATPPICPTLMKEARKYATRQPKFLMPPVLSRDRLTVGKHSLWLYSSEDCKTEAEMWASALSSMRFNNGPRTSAPFRELYRLSEPEADDDSDWAENIRWAKEQFRAFGVVTWTEYDYHLEQITEERRKECWVSEEVVCCGIQRRR